MIRSPTYYRRVDDKSNDIFQKVNILILFKHALRFYVKIK